MVDPKIGGKNETTMMQLKFLKETTHRHKNKLEFHEWVHRYLENKFFDPKDIL